MKTKKLSLPVMAFICAMGMAFAPGNFSGDPDNDYLEIPNSPPFKIDEQDCGSGLDPCKARFQGQEAEYNVFDDASLTTPKMGNGKVNVIIP